jgi:hypothetical protein
MKMNAYKQEFDLLISKFVDVEEEIDFRVMKSIKAKYQIYDQYFSKDIDGFVNFLLERDNFIYFLVRMKSLSMMPWDVFIEIVKKIVEPLFHKRLDMEDVLLFDEQIMTQVLLTYYTYYARDWNLFYDQYDNVCKKYGLMEIEDDLEDVPESEIEQESIELYKQIIVKKYVQPIIKKLYPLRKKLLPQNKFDEARMIKDFYEQITKNSFNQAIQEFQKVLPNILKKLKTIDFKIDFEDFSKEAISHIKSLQENVSFGRDGTFHNMKGVEQWMSLLEKLQINHEDQQATLLNKAIKEYILAYSLKKAIDSNNKSNKIMGKDFALISEFSPLLHYTKQLMDLDKSEFNYIFVKLVKYYGQATNEEVAFLIDKFVGLKKVTFLQYEEKNILPLIAESDCPLIEFY